MSGNRRIIPPAYPTDPSLHSTIHRLAPQRDWVEHEDPTEAYPEGDVVPPEACWFQHPEASKIAKYYKPERQWGDRKLITIQNLQTITFAQLLDLKLELPAVCSVRLSAVDVSGQLATPTNDLAVIWTLDIGCGRALQIANIQQRVQPQLAIAADQAGTAGSTLSDLQFTLPIHALRVSGKVVDKLAAANIIFEVECVAMVAPFTAYPGMVAR